MGTEERMEPGLGEGERGAGSKERGGEVRFVVAVGMGGE